MAKEPIAGTGAKARQKPKPAREGIPVKLGSLKSTGTELRLPEKLSPEAAFEIALAAGIVTPKRNLTKLYR
jgi:hypothetical protein